MPVDSPHCAADFRLYGCVDCMALTHSEIRFRCRSFALMRLAERRVKSRPWRLAGEERRESLSHGFLRRTVPPPPTTSTIPSDLFDNFLDRSDFLATRYSAVKRSSAPPASASARSRTHCSVPFSWALIHLLDLHLFCYASTMQTPRSCPRAGYTE